MSLSSALSIAMSGLSANQTALSIVTSNVANAQTPGYVARSATQVEVSNGNSGDSVTITGVNRQVDQYIQSQLRTETAGGGYADQMSNVLTRLQNVYGTPGNAGTLETTYNNFTSALQALSTSSGSSAAQGAALTAAQSLAQQLNTTTQGIQTLRTNAEQDIGTSVTQANSLMQQIAQLNTQLQGMKPTDQAAATLMDQRDSAIGQLSQLMDLKVVTDTNNQANIYTSSGVQLVGGQQASQLSFNAQSTLNANTVWNANPAKSGVGDLSIKLPNGATIDMVANNSITSGRIAADLNLRDKVLVQAQSQVDQLAATLSSSVSDQTTAGSAVTSGTQTGFNVDLSNVQPGNSISLSYTNTATGKQQQVTVVRVDDPAALPLPASMSAAGNTVIGVNFTGGMASVASQLNTALGPVGLQFSNPSASTLQVLNSGTSATVNAASATATTSSLANGSPQLPLFTDGNSPYTGVITGVGAQQTGYAGRITVNPALVSDPTKFTVYSTSPPTSAGDTTRSDFLYSQLTSGTYTYSPQTGLGSTASPFKGTLSNYMQQFLSLQSNAASSATQLQQGQDVVVNTLQQKLNSTSAVSVDTEMSNLISLQNAYSANAHVMSVVQSMMTALMQIPV
jgi:flagellar hook-associated protein 1 FlgK